MDVSLVPLLKLGDVNPMHVHRQENACEGDGFAEADMLGRRVADAVASVLASTEVVAGGVEVVSHQVIDVPVGGTPLAEWWRGPAIPVELVEWSVGPIRVVSLPGEAFHALGRAVEVRVGGPVVLAGLSPVWQGYLPVPFVDGGYEERTSYGPEAVAHIADALTR